MSTRGCVMPRPRPSPRFATAGSIPGTKPSTRPRKSSYLAVVLNRRRPRPAPRARGRGRDRRAGGRPPGGPQSGSGRPATRAPPARATTGSASSRAPPSFDRPGGDDYSRAHVKLADKVAIVTGTSPNIGGGIAEGLAEEGARVVCVDVAADNAQQCAEAIRGRGGQALGLVCDVTDERQVEAMVAQARAAYG